MNNDIEIFFESILEDENLAKQFLEMETIDDMYNFCVSRSNINFSKNDFDKFVSKMLEYYAGTMDSLRIAELSDENLKGIAGGKITEKIVSAATAAFNRKEPKN